MSKSSDFDKEVKRYLIRCMDVSDYDVEVSGQDELIKAVYNIFQSEMGWRITQAGELQAAIDWLSGLASACSIAFYSSEIIELAIAWGSDFSDIQEEQFLANYWNLMANKLLQLFHGYRVPAKN